MLFLCLLFGSWQDLEAEKVLLVPLTATEYAMLVQSGSTLDRAWCEPDRCWYFVNNDALGQVPGGFPVGLRPRVIAKNGDVNGAYHSYPETKAMLEDLANRFPGQAKLATIGKTVEDRAIQVLTISNLPTEQAAPNLYIIGGHHAREWISVEIPLLFAKYLLDHREDLGIADILNHCRIHILPLLNPDGLQFSIYTYRFWRKNRRYLGDFQWGVDLNRNYGFRWGLDDEGSSPSPGSNVYRGEGPFSEPETAALQSYMIAHPPASAISYHNYSQAIVYPWGHKNQPTRDGALLEDIAREMAATIGGVNGSIYTFGQSGTSLYFTNGDFVDWVYGTFAVPAFTLELPPVFLWQGGFVTDAGLIDAVFLENKAGLLYWANRLISQQVDNRRDK